MLNLPVRVALAAVTLALLPAMPQPAQAQSADAAVSREAAALLNDPASPVIGNPVGDVPIIEFFDYACSYCKAIEPRLESLLDTDHGVKLILKEFPILTPESTTAAKASLAARRQHKYAQFHRALMGYRGPWNETVIFDTAKSVGLDLKRLRKDMASPAVTDELLANFNLARALRIFQTPGFIVGAHILTGPSAQIDFPAVVAAARGH
jgi:protein-disulfide isomerase